MLKFQHWYGACFPMRRFVATSMRRRVPVQKTHTNTKMYTKKLQITTAAIGLMSIASLSTAKAELEGALTGSISLDMNSHFISYGADVWADGERTFNPAVSINYAINDQWTFTTGFWLDVNDNASSSFETVETDVWVGLSYTTGITTISGTFQNWQYAGVSEEVFDLGISLDTFLSPSLTIHKRFNAGGSGGFEGTFAVLGFKHGFDVTDDFSVSVPVSIGWALDEFHTTEDGYGFASVGLQGSLAINACSSFNFGVSYYDTDSGVTGNADNSFFTYNAGFSYDF